jgi:hypothetical protein
VIETISIYNINVNKNVYIYLLKIKSLGRPTVPNLLGAPPLVI